MAAGRTDALLAELNALKARPASGPEALAAIEQALRGKSNVVAARAAEIVEQHQLASLEPALVAAFERFLHDGGDKGCMAKTAIARALIAVESRAEGTLLRGARHVQLEPAFPKAYDAAAELRAACAVALVNMRARQAMTVLVHHLADKEPFVRAAAVRSLAAHGGDAAEALVRFKLLVGDVDHAVIADCFPAAIALTRATEPVEPFLDSDNEGLREAAILAVGESRLPRAFELLRDRWDREVDPAMRKLLATSIALTRQPAGVTFLVGIAQGSDVQSACIAVEALGMYRGDDGVRQRVQEVAEKRREVLESFWNAFGGR